MITIALREPVFDGTPDTYTKLYNTARLDLTMMRPIARDRFLIQHVVEPMIIDCEVVSFHQRRVKASTDLMRDIIRNS